MATKPKLKAGATATTVAKHLDISQPRVTQLADEGVFARNSDSRYDIDECRVAYIRWLRDDQRRVTKAAGANRVSDARARKIELEVAKEENRLVETDRALAIVDEIIGIYRTGFGALPARASRDLSIRRRIEDECDAIQREVAKALAKRAAALRSGDASLDTVEEADA